MVFFVLLCVDFRFSNAEELQQVKATAEEVASISYIDSTTCELVLESLRDAMELTETTTALLDKINKIFDENGLPTVSMRITGDGSDAEYTTQTGIPTIDSIGVSGGGIHAKNEYARISTLKDAAKKIASICYCIE